MQIELSQTVKEQLETAAKMEAQKKELGDSFEETKKWLELDEQQNCIFRAVGRHLMTKI